jgi:hypothetical protein
VGDLTWSGTLSFELKAGGAEKALKRARAEMMPPVLGVLGFWCPGPLP